MIVDLHILTHNSLVPAEALLPELITEDDERVLICDPALVQSKSAAQGRLQSEGRKVIARNEFGPGAFRRALRAKADGGRRVANEVGKNVLKLSIVLKIRIGDIHGKLDVFASRGEND